MSNPILGMVSPGSTSWKADGLPAKGADYKAVEEFSITVSVDTCDGLKGQEWPAMA